MARLLHSGDFPTRERATRDLRAFGELAAPALHQALAGRPPLESRRRLQSLLQQADFPAGECLQALRAVEVLEWINHPQGRLLLAALAKGSPESHLTHAARATLRRLQKK